MVKIEGRVVKRPSVVCDTAGYIVIKFGEYEEMKEYYNVVRRAYSEINKTMFNKVLNQLGLPKLNKPMETSIELIELPDDQEVVEKVFYITGYLGGLIGKQADNIIKVNFESIL